MDTINKKRQTDEIRRCARDPIYFFNTYVKVSHPTKGPIPFATYPFQDECVKAFLENRFVIVNKSRQLGLSTLAAAHAAWLLLFHRNKEIIIMATKLQVAQNFIKKVKFTIKNLPKWLVLPKLEKDNDRSLMFSAPSNSRIEAIPTAADAGRSEALSLLIVDEAAHVSDFEELWKGLWPTLSCIVGGTKVLLDDGFHDIEELCGDHDVGDYFELKGNIFGKDGLEPLSHGYVSPDGETLRITTRHGLELEVTHDHPLWRLDARSGGRMTPAKELAVGDHLRVQHSMGVFGNDNSLDHPLVREITPALAYLVGGYIAEGWMGHDRYGICVSNNDPEFRDAFLNNDIVKPFHPRKGTQKLLCCSRDLVTVFEAVGVDHAWKCDTKRVPKRIWRCSKDVIAAFLRGYFDRDGSATAGAVCASSTSRGLIADIHQLLLNFGIIPKIIASDLEKAKQQIGVRYIANNKRPLQSVRQSWGIHIPRSQCKRFLDEIGFAIKRKQARIEKWATEFSDDERKQHKVPLTSDITGRLECIVRESSHSSSWFRSMGVRIPEKRNAPLSDKKHRQETCRYTSAEWVRDFSQLLKRENIASEADLRFLDELAAGDYYWDPIVKIERSRNKTFDFTVPGSHSFLQNSILGSNTGGRALIISTPKGVGNWFHKLWTDAELGKNDFFPVQLPWTVHPERDEAWFSEQASNMSPKAVSQELLCVGEATRIPTKCGFKLAADIREGDEVLTHKGRFRRVLKTYERYVGLDESVYSVSTPMNRKTGIILTGNHPVLSMMGDRSGAMSSLDYHPVDRLVQHGSEYVTNVVRTALYPTFSRENLRDELKQIDLATLVGGSECFEDRARYPRQWGSNKRFIDVNFDLGRFLGLWLSDGYANPNDRFGVGFGFHIDEYETLLKFVDDFLSKLDIRTRPSKSSYSNACRIETHNQFIVKLIRSFTTGHYAHDKKLRWDVLMKTNEQFIRGLLIGYFDGDGDHRPQRKLKVVSVHSELLYQVRTLLSMYGHYPRIDHWKNQPAYLEFDCVDGRKLEELLEGTRTEILQRPGSRIFLRDGYFFGTPRFSKLTNVEPIRVFNFEVEEDHTYIADSLVVHNCDFLASGDTYMDAADIQWIGSCVKDPIRREGYDRNVWVWADPIQDKSVKYLISADVGRGDADASAFHVLCTLTGEVVAEFRGRIRPDFFARLLIEYGKKYNNALICPERNTFGHHVIIELVNNRYTNIYFEDQKGVYLGDYIPPERVSEAGFDTQASSRKKIIVKLEEVIRNKQIKVYSARLWNELKTFVTYNDKPQALKNCSDDLIMSLAIAVWLFDTTGVHGQFASELNRAMMAGFGVSVNHFDNLAGNGNEVLPSWTSMMPYASNGNGSTTKPSRPIRPGDPSDISWLWRK